MTIPEAEEAIKKAQVTLRIARSDEEWFAGLKAFDYALSALVAAFDTFADTAQAAGLDTTPERICAAEMRSTNARFRQQLVTLWPELLDAVGCTDTVVHRLVCPPR